jgi:eukaryotic-like serine/threonine-protein kinase
MTLTAGTQVDGYEVLGLLGSGGMGEVYRARDSGLKREVAIKVLPSFVSQDPDRLRRFEQEARAAAALNHPNILAVFQLGTYQGAPYLVSELLEGETLRQQMMRSRLALRRVIDYGVQIARGLAAAHEKVIVHRDLKPENLFVTKDGRIKILDFGLAKLIPALRGSEHGSESDALTLTERTDPGIVMGTAGYMSPEQVRGKPADNRADIFAFGAILYEMLAGKRAFQKPTSAETMTAILNEDPPGVSQVAPNIPPGLQRVVHRCLEKDPQQRFHSASDLAFALEALSDSASASTGAITPTKLRIRWTRIVASGVAIAVAAALVAWWRLPPAVPQVLAVTQLTDDGEPKQGRLVTDGSRIYFNEGQPGSWRIAQVSVTGGQTAPVSTRLVDPQIAALMPDNSALLALVGGFNDPVYPLWLIPLPVGEPRRVGDVEVLDASFFPDGRIAFTQGNALFIAEKNGSNPRKLTQSNRAPFAPSVSPDGSRVNVTLCCDGSPESLQEIVIGSNRSYEVLKAEQDVRPCCSRWTPDGRYLLFQSLRNGRSDLWAIPEQTGLFRHLHAPVPITNGPLSYTDAVASHDGKQIFAIGSKPRGELVRYDEKTREYVPYLSAISATDPTFSRDGQWVAYRSYPDYALWRSRTDGSDRHQLTYPPAVVMFPFISPDGAKVAFGTNNAAVFVVTMEGGAPRKIAEPCFDGTWSPDSNLLALTCAVPGKHMGEKNSLELSVADLQSGKISTVPGSQGKLGAQWVDQQTLVAATEDATKFLTFDLRTQKWFELASGVFVNWIISPDGKYLDCTTGGAEPMALRIRFSDHKVESITSLKGFRRVVDPNTSTQIDVAPDGSLLFTRDIGTQEIYALDVKWP